MSHNPPINQAVPHATPLSYGQHARALLGLGIPLVGSSVAGFLIHMTDTVMLGWYSVTALAAATIATSFWFITFILGAGFGYAVMSLVAAAAAAGDETTARRATRMALWLSLAYAIAVQPLMFWSETVFLALGQTPDVAAEGQRYLRIAGFGMIPALLAVVIRSYLSAMHLTAVMLWVTLGAVAVNACLNYALIFGNWGAPEWGIEGAAVTSVLVQTTILIVLAIYAQWKLPEYRLYQRLWKIDPSAMRDVFRLGVPIGFTSLAESGFFTASAVMMGWIGEVELAAHGIALQLVALMFMFHVGMSQAATIRAGHAFGRRDEGELRRGAKTAFGVAILFGIGVIVIFLAIPEQLISLFLDPTEPQRVTLLHIGGTLVMLAALFQFVDSAQIVTLSLLRGVQDTTVPMWLAAISYWIIGLPSSWLMAFGFGWGPVGIWLGLVVGLGSASMLLLWRFWGRSVHIAVVAPKV